MANQENLGKSRTPPETSHGQRVSTFFRTPFSFKSRRQLVQTTGQTHDVDMNHLLLVPALKPLFRLGVCGRSRLNFFWTTRVHVVLVMFFNPPHIGPGVSEMATVVVAVTLFVIPPLARSVREWFVGCTCTAASFLSQENLPSTIMRFQVVHFFSQQHKC